MKKTMQDALNNQINEELYSAYLYFSMAAHFDAENLEGFAGWMKAQAQEEVMHAMKIYHYINEAGGRAILKPIQGPQTEWKSPLAAFEDSLKHERHITDRIHKLVSQAKSEEDYATEIMLQWFVTEQVEEEASVSGVVEKLRLVSDHKHMLLMMDRELGSRAAK